jgi:hypothetical protein
LSWWDIVVYRNLEILRYSTSRVGSGDISDEEAVMVKKADSKKDLERADVKIKACHRSHAVLTTYAFQAQRAIYVDIQTGRNTHDANREAKSQLCFARFAVVGHLRVTTRLDQGRGEAGACAGSAARGSRCLGRESITFLLHSLGDGPEITVSMEFVVVLLAIRLNDGGK